MFGKPAGPDVMETDRTLTIAIDGRSGYVVGARVCDSGPLGKFFHLLAEY